MVLEVFARAEFSEEPGWILYFPYENFVSQYSHGGCFALRSSLPCRSNFFTAMACWLTADVRNEAVAVSCPRFPRSKIQSKIATLRRRPCLTFVHQDLE